MAMLLTPFLGSPRWGWGGHDTLKEQARGWWCWQVWERADRKWGAPKASALG